MKSAPLHGQGGPFGLSLLLHAVLLLLFLIGLGGARAPKRPGDAKIVQARIVEDLRAPPSKGRALKHGLEAAAEPTSRSETDATEHADDAARRIALPDQPRTAQSGREQALQERRQRQQLEDTREAEQAAKAAERAKDEARKAAERRAVEQLKAAKASADARAEAEAREAKLQAEARSKAEVQAKAEQGARARAEKEAQAKARAEADAKRKAELAAQAAEDKAAKSRAESEAKARAEKEARARAEAEAKARVDKEARAKAEKEATAKAEAKRKAEQERLAQAEREQALKEQLEAEQQESRLKLQIDDAARRWLSSRIEPRVEGHWLRPPSAQGGMTCIIAIRATATGTVIAATVTKSSGDEAFDRSAEAAVRKASPLPMPPDPNVAEQFLSFSLRFKP